MVSVSAHILQVIMLPTSTHTLLAVHHTLVLGQLTPGICRAQEDGLELEQQCKSVNIFRRCLVQWTPTVLWQL